MTDLVEQIPTVVPLAGLPLGSVIASKYRIDSVLGAGGMGVVLAATHLDLESAVAIKVMRPEFAGNEEVVGRMLFEARAAAKLRGRHVARVLDVARLESGAPYIVMERLEGRDLADALNELHAFAVQDAVDYVLQACEGLAEAHALGIVHRDLKPENLFLALTPEGSVLKILDFGISKDVGALFTRDSRIALTNAGSAVGSPYYMAPEQMRASVDIDQRADIWSLGCILFELLTGTCAFDGDSLALVCAQVLNEPAPLLRNRVGEVPEQLDAIVSRCLEKDPERRFDDVGQLAAALKDFASAEGQRSAERSLRVASGINLKSDGPAARVSQPLLPAADSSSGHLARVLTPARPRAAQPGAESRARNRSFGLAAWVLGTTVLLALGAAFWSFRARAENAVSLNPALPAVPTLAHSVPPSEIALSTSEARAAVPVPVAVPSVASSASAKSALAPRATTRHFRPEMVTSPAPHTAPTSTRSISAAADGVAEPSPPPAPTTSAVITDLDRMGGRY
jgi:serine/threonine-protein kinase